MILDVIIPIYNKERSITNIYNKIVDELKDIKYNIIFVDDNSSDKTLTVLKSIQKQDEERIKVICLSKIYGKDLSVYAGINHSSHDLTCIYDIDSQVGTQYIKKMYDYLINHSDCDQVCMYSNYSGTSGIKRAKLKIFNKMFKLNVDNNIIYTRIFRKNIKEAVKYTSKYYNFSKYIFEIIGFNTYYIKYDSSKIQEYNLRTLLEYSDNPFKPFKLLSTVLLAISFIYLLLYIFNVVRINESILLFIILLLFALELYTKNNINRCLFKKCRTYYTVKEKIGFDEDFL